MHIKRDPDVNALYITFGEGEVARTVAISEAVYADLDEVGNPLGLEFINADDFIPFLRERVTDVAIPLPLREMLGAYSSRS